MMSMLSINKLLAIEDTRSGCYRFFKLTDYLYVFGLVFHILMIPLMLKLNADVVARYNIFSILIFLSSLILNRKGQHNLAFTLAFLEVNVHTYVTTYYLGWESGFYHYILLLAPMIFFSPIKSINLKIFASILLITSFTVLFHTYHERIYGEILYAAAIGHYLLYLNTVATVILYSCIGYYYSQAADDNEEKLRTAQQEAEWIAHTDPLTHIGNRRSMTREVHLQVSHARRTQDSFIIVLGDIDNFKAINDDYGHDYGDYVLISTATLISNSLRQHDHVARWGGEEFMILLPNTQADKGLQIIDRLREKIASNTHHYKGKEYPGITMTFGLCQYDNNYDINDCINGADQALYQGKHQGKNRTILHANKQHHPRIATL
jgi:diguanylate cyclase (GGDEF)-like protein